MAEKKGKKVVTRTDWVKMPSGCRVIGGLCAHAQVVPSDDGYEVSVFSFGNMVADSLVFLNLRDAKRAAEKRVYSENSEFD